MSIGAFISFLHLKQEPGMVGFIVAWLGGSIFLLWFARRVKFVSLDEEYLYVRNFSKEIRIPLSQVASVNESFFSNPKQITLLLSSPSEFGSKIVFVPPLQWFGQMRKHPLVAELRQRINTQKMV
jgi:hypothetical protein